ncbi:MAG TPA: CPBP family intramembrane glutamic endopeptidase [Terracidiphilus sp.]|jgi:hypothetical protein|nr:CPBP family intramembrane glutamic endopeptidase [Terracidiphilus sp.]
MEPETPTPLPVVSPHQGTFAGLGNSPENGEGRGPVPGARDLRWVFMGLHELRAGWSVAIFLVLLMGLVTSFTFVIKALHLAPESMDKVKEMTVRLGFMQEGASVLAIVVSAWIVARIERRRLSDYYLRGPRRVARFFSGLVTGFATLSLLVAGLTAGGWMHFGGVALSGGQIVMYAAGWCAVFLLVGCAEEGLARCFLLFTLARGLNFWVSFGLVVAMCALATLNPKASGLWGAYVIALLGLAPCVALHVQKAPTEGFWEAAWVTSVFFGAGHTANPGENWIGIFAAAGIGFVFCASVRLTGSVWWAIGCHAAWDWAESYFYGTPDSGLLAKGHLLTTTYSGPAIWSGGSDGPEGSLLTIPVMMVILLVLLVQYGRGPRAPAAEAIGEQAAG